MFATGHSRTSATMLHMIKPPKILGGSRRRRMGVEPTRDGDYRPADGFEDREAHRDPSASSIM